MRTSLKIFIQQHQLSEAAWAWHKIILLFFWDCVVQLKYSPPHRHHFCFSFVNSTISTVVNDWTTACSKNWDVAVDTYVA